MLDTPFEILIIDDDVNAVEYLAQMLRGIGRLRFATRAEDGLKRIQECQPDLVLLDIELPGMSGFELCRRIKQDPNPLLADIPIIFITAHANPDEELHGLNLGAVDFIHKPARGPLVAARVRTHLRLKRLTDTLKRSAATDVLTGIANRRSFVEALQREWMRAQRHQQMLALLMVDVDHFKAYNDHYGHPAGDECLRLIAQALHSVLQRATDHLARYGGEEFVALLPDTDSAGAQEIAQAFLTAVDRLALPHAGHRPGACVSISIGLDVQVPQQDSPALLLTRADAALYRAKAAGRHTHVLYQHSGPQGGHNGDEDLFSRPSHMGWLG